MFVLAGRSSALHPGLVCVQNCTSTPVKCREYQWQCGDSGQCIPQSWRCDGKEDCHNSLDENQCERFFAVLTSDQDYSL